METTCGSKAPGDKESEGLLSGDQAQLPLQKLRHSRVMGHAAGRWEQPLFHCSHTGQQQGCRGLLAIPTGAFWTSGTRACVCSQPEAGEADRAGRACRDTLHCLQSQICRKGRQAGVGRAGLARLWSLPVAAGPAARGQPAAAQSWPKGTTTLQMGWPGPLTGAKVQRCSGSALRPLACQSLRPFVAPPRPGTSLCCGGTLGQRQVCIQ